MISLLSIARVIDEILVDSLGFGGRRKARGGVDSNRAARDLKGHTA